jgi:hypothetical protein
VIFYTYADNIKTGAHSRGKVQETFISPNEHPFDFKMTRRNANGLQNIFQALKK